MIDLSDIEAARERIAGRVRRTPILPVGQVKTNLPVGGEVTLKLECLQVTGSFKTRGAMNRFLGTPEADRPQHLITASGGNHGLAVARTAAVAGVPATVFVPEIVSPAKVVKMEAWGATVTVAGSEWSQSAEAALAFAERDGGTYIHPFADPLVVAGQGTLGLELLDQLEAVDAVAIAIGGGGLVSGVGTAIRALRPEVRIIGVEPVGSPTLKACLDAGRVITLPEVTTGVATLACARTEEAVFETVRDVVDDIVLVDDEDLIEASRWLWFEFGVAADLSGAAAIAGLRRHPDAFGQAASICALVCGAGAEGTGG